MVGKSINMGGRLRNSNLELYRIIMMMLIVAHHFVVNSNLWDVLKTEEITWRTYYFYILSAWGKPAIDGFMLITGYFMCKQNITVQKYIHLLSQILFYNIVIFALFVLNGMLTVTSRSLFMCLFPYDNVDKGFVGCFLLFYLFIPFLSRLVNGISKKEHLYLILLCLFMYSFLEMVPNNGFSMNYVSWFCVIFFIGSYIRFYSLPKADKTSLWAILMFLFMGIGIVSILIGAHTGKFTHFFVGEVNRFFAIGVAVASFMTFKSLKMGQIKVINMISSSTFAVLLIHANCNEMRQWLWTDFVDAAAVFHGENYMGVSISIIMFVFFSCIGIDMIRKYLSKKVMIGFEYLRKYRVEK